MTPGGTLAAGMGRVVDGVNKTKKKQNYYPPKKQQQKITSTGGIIWYMSQLG